MPGGVAAFRINIANRIFARLTPAAEEVSNPATVGRGHDLDELAQ
jgi:hypothetical protein